MSSRIDCSVDEVPTRAFMWVTSFRIAIVNVPPNLGFSEAP